MNNQINYKLRSLIFKNLEQGALQALDPKSKEFFETSIQGTKNLFEISDAITRPEFDLRKTDAISDDNLTELCHYISRASDDAELFYSELIHYDYNTAVMLQAFSFIWLQENSYLTDPEIAMLMVIIYERLFAYDLEEIYDTLQSMNPEEDDIDDYSNSTIEVYDSSEFSDCDEEFQTFISEMIDCLEKAGFSTEEEED